jgi:ribonuclease HII
MLKPYFDPRLSEAGCDEAGRGCLAGPVFAAAVILPKSFRHPLLNDSKQLTAQQRLELRCIIKEAAVDWAVAMAEPAEIDEVNILNASFLAMHRAISQLDPQPELLLIDGNRFRPYPNLPAECVIKGDATYMSIAAASILAKTYRDEYMHNLAGVHPEYGWVQNKGYPTVAHRRAIRDHGPTQHHRRSFRLLPEGTQGRLFT